MSEPGAVVTDETFVLRRVPLAKYDPSLPEAPIELDVFLARNDPDGLSVYRESVHRANPAGILLAVPEERRDRFCVAKIPTSLLAELGLTLVIAPTDDVEGHCLIPEMTRDTYRADKARWKDVARRFSTAAEVVFSSPEPRPTA